MSAEVSPWTGAIAAPVPTPRMANPWTGEPMTKNQIADHLVSVAYQQAIKPNTRGGRNAVKARIKDALNAGYDPYLLQDMIENELVVWTNNGITVGMAKRQRSESVDSRNLRILRAMTQ